MNTSVNEKTNVPIGLAVLAIGGGAFWLSALYSDVQNLKTQVAEVKSDVKTLLKREHRIATGVEANPAAIRHADNHDPEGSDS